MKGFVQTYGAACCGSLEKARDPCEATCAVAPVVSGGFKVTVIIALPMGTTSFTASKQDAFKTSVATMAGVTAAAVSIDKIYLPTASEPRLSKCTRASLLLTCRPLCLSHLFEIKKKLNQEVSFVFVSGRVIDRLSDR